MDRLVRRFEAAPDDDLMVSVRHGVAWQRDMNHRVPYDAAYFDKCKGYEGQEIAQKINAGRVALVNEFIGDWYRVLDIGVGSGEFIQNRPNTWGYDINPAAKRWLMQAGRWASEVGEFDAFTFWDVLEHVETPEEYFRHMPRNAYLFACLPVFEDVRTVRRSKHYRPGEHLYYWTEKGFTDWMSHYGFKALACRDFEIQAGREAIKSFAFQRSLPDYWDTIFQYEQLHARTYGVSSGIYLKYIGPHVLALNPSSILDFGCGRSDLVAHFWRDGTRRIGRYDPAVRDYKLMPDGKFEMVLCNDVMEHIPFQNVDRIFAEIKAISTNVMFTISLWPARAKLPDGRNAHVTLLTADEWMTWIKDYFGKVERIPTEWGDDHILMVKTW